MKGKLLILLLLATVTLLTFSAVASAGGRPTAPTMTFISPSPSEGATLATNAVSFAFTYNRAPKLTKALTYELSGPTASSGTCDTPTALKGGSSRSGKSFSDLANGSYTFTVSLTCIDGSSATATRHFTVSVAPPGHIYWSDTTKNTIGRAKMDGTGVQTDFITGAGAPSRLAVDGTHVYWANNSYSSSSIGRANLDGTEASHSFITGMLSPVGVAVDATYVYFTNQGYWIGRANLDGSAQNNSFFGDGSTYYATGLAVDGSYVYWVNLNWADPSACTILRTSTLGTGAVETLISGCNRPNSVAVDGTYVYWNSYEGGTIGRARLDGSDQPNQSWISGLSGPVGLAVDGTYIYWCNAFSGTIGRAKPDGSDVRPSFINTGTTDTLMGVAVSTVDTD